MGEEEYIKQRVESISAKLDKINGFAPEIAVLEYRIAELEKDLDNVGKMVRAIDKTILKWGVVISIITAILVAVMPQIIHMWFE